MAGARLVDLGDIVLIVPVGIQELRRQLTDAVTDTEWRWASQGFGDPDLANE